MSSPSRPTIGFISTKVAAVSAMKFDRDDLTALFNRAADAVYAHALTLVDPAHEDMSASDEEVRTATRDFTSTSMATIFSEMARVRSMKDPSVSELFENYNTPDDVAAAIFAATSRIEKRLAEKGGGEIPIGMHDVVAFEMVGYIMNPNP